MAAIHADEKADYSPPSYEVDGQPEALHGNVANVAFDKPQGHSHDADVAMRALEQLGDVEIDEATSKRLLRKIDWNLMPVKRPLMSFSVPLATVV